MGSEASKPPKDTPETIFSPVKEDRVLGKAPSGSNPLEPPKLSQEQVEQHGKVRRAALQDFLDRFLLLDQSILRLIHNGSLDRTIWEPNEALFHWAASQGFNNLLKSLLDLGVTVNCLRDDPKGSFPSALSCALEHQREETALFLAKSGADFRIAANNENIDTSDLRKKGLKNLAELIESKDKKVEEVKSKTPKETIDEKNRKLAKAKVLMVEEYKIDKEEDALLEVFSGLLQSKLKTFERRRALMENPDFLPKDAIADLVTEIHKLESSYFFLT